MTGAGRATQGLMHAGSILDTSRRGCRPKVLHPSVLRSFWSFASTRVILRAFRPLVGGQLDLIR